MGDFFFLQRFVAGHQVLYAAVIIIITIVLARTTLFVLEGILKTQKKSKAVDHKLLSVVETPLIITIVLVGTELAVRSVIINYEQFNQVILSIAIIILTYLLIRLGGIILDVWSRRVSRTKGEEFHSEILPLTKSVLSIVLSVLGVLLIMQVWKVEIKTIITSIGVAGVVLGFAFKQTLENIMGGISLIMDNSFRKGDLIQLDNGDIGEVLEINLRSTKIKNFDSESIIVPNGLLANTRFINLAQPTPTVRIRLPISVAYGSDPEKVKQVLHDSLRHHKDILTMPRRQARFVGFGASSIDFDLFFYINDYKMIWDIKDQVLTQLYKDLYREGIEIPFPIRTIVQAKRGQYDPQWDVKAAAPAEDKKP